jgi:predicted metal-dependent hydrolase
MPAYPDAYIQYLAYFHGHRDYFECHEVLEEYWKSHPDDAYRQTVVGLIQIAVSLYHQRRGNLQGGLKMLKSALRNLQEEQMTHLGMDSALFIEQLQHRLSELEHAESFRFTDMNIPLTDEALERACRQACGTLGSEWLRPSDTGNTFLVDKHKLRDRTEVVAERERQKQRKQQQRTNAHRPN